MNDHDFHFRVRQHLNTSTRQLSPSISIRLHQSRQKALEHQKLSVRRFSMAGIGGVMTEYILPRGKTVLAMLAVVLAALGTGFLGDLLRTADMEEVDSALLADDLPIDAYLDRGFDAWVQHNSPD